MRGSTSPRIVPHDGCILSLYQHKEWWMRPIWERTFSDIPERTQLLLWRSSDTWYAMLAVCEGNIRADSQSSTSVMTVGAESYGEATIGRHEGLDTAAVGHFGNALINCMGMAPENYWHRPASPIVRSSDDYLPHNPRSLAEHVMQNAFNALLMGELYHCDWDMFWSEHPHAWAHGIMRVLSGGPVYCSDAEGHTDEGMLRGLLCPGGELPRPDSPGLPTLDSLLRDPRKSATALGIYACFGECDVTAYLGLCEEHEQETRITARRPGNASPMGRLWFSRNSDCLVRRQHSFPACRNAPRARKKKRFAYHWT